MKSTTASSKTNTRRGGKNTTTATRGRTGSSAKKTETSGESEKTPLEQMFRDLLADTLGAEQKIVEALPELIEAASTDTLKEAFEDHLHVTQRQIKRLEKVYSLLGEEASAQKCEVLEAMVKEARKGIKSTPEGSMTRDAFLIIAAQKVEHYEIAAYGSLVQIALTLELDEIATLLEKTLSEEEDTDMLLTEIAETEVNPMADNETEETETASETEEQDEEETEE